MIAPRLYTADTVLCGPAGTAVNDGAVIVDGPTVTAVGRREELERLVGPDTPVEAFGDATIMPGIINAHVHLVFHAGPNAAAVLEDERDDTELLRKMGARAETLLRSGVTTVRDLGDRDGLSLRVRDTVDAGEVAGPRILAATVPLTPPKGHCHYLGGVVEGESGIREAIGRLAERGADVIKVMASGGENTSGPYAMWDPQFTLAELRAAVDEAHGRGLAVAAHAHSADGIERVVTAGVDTVEHATWLTTGFELDRRQDVAQQMAEQGTVFCHASSNNWRGLAKLASEEWALQLAGRVAWFDSLGVEQIAGTDAGITSFAESPAALARFGEHGFTPERAVEIGTAAAARALGLAETTGTLKAGLSADMLIVRGNVLNDLNSVTNTLQVIFRGTPVDPETHSIDDSE